MFCKGAVSIIVGTPQDVSKLTVSRKSFLLQFHVCHLNPCLVHLKINNGCAIIPFKSISHLVSQTTSILANAPTDPFRCYFRTTSTLHLSSALLEGIKEKREFEGNGWWMWISARLKRVYFSVLCTHPLSWAHRYRIYYTSASDGTEYYFILQFSKWNDKGKKRSLKLEQWNWAQKRRNLFGFKNQEKRGDVLSRIANKWLYLYHQMFSLKAHFYVSKRNSHSLNRSPSNFPYN